MLQNLLTNARKYGSAGGWVGVRLLRRQQWLRVEVADRGPGLPDEQERRRVFTRYYRTPAARKQAEGTGLGLAIAREIILRHRGRIGVENQPEGGALFWFELPAA